MKVFNNTFKLKYLTYGNLCENVQQIIFGILDDELVSPLGI